MFLYCIVYVYVLYSVVYSNRQESRKPAAGPRRETPPAGPAGRPTTKISPWHVFASYTVTTSMCRLLSCLQLNLIGVCLLTLPLPMPLLIFFSVCLQPANSPFPPLFHLSCATHHPIIACPSICVSLCLSIIATWNCVGRCLRHCKQAGCRPPSGEAPGSGPPGGPTRTNFLIGIHPCPVFIVSSSTFCAYTK